MSQPYSQPGEFNYPARLWRWLMRLDPWSRFGAILVAVLAIGIVVAFVLFAAFAPPRALTWKAAQADLDGKVNSMALAAGHGHESDLPGWRQEIIKACDRYSVLASDGSTAEQRAKNDCALIGHPMP